MVVVSILFNYLLFCFVCNAANADQSASVRCVVDVEALILQSGTLSCDLCIFHLLINECTFPSVSGRWMAKRKKIRKRKVCSKAGASTCDWGNECRRSCGSR